MCIQKSAKHYKILFSISALCTVASSIYALLIIINTDYHNSPFFFATILTFFVIEWFLAYYYERIKIRRLIKLGIPDNAINIEEGYLDLQKQLFSSLDNKKELWDFRNGMNLQKIDLDLPKEEKKSGVENILMIIGMIIIFTPFLFAFSFRGQSNSLQTPFLFFGFIFITMVFSFGSGIQAGFAGVLIEIEKKTGKRIVIKELN
jgi:hypothetical protein